MIEYVFMNGNEEELWEIDYEKKFALDVSELNVVKDKVRLTDRFYFTQYW
jgi:hypothetical protein